MALTILKGGVLQLGKGGLQIYNASGFNPASYGTVAAWYKADAGTSTTTDGTAVTQWNDQSGNNRHLTRATAGPVYKTSALNGKPVLRYQASPSTNNNGLIYDAGAGVSWLTGTSVSVFVVYVPRASSGSPDARVVSSGSTTSLTDFSGTDRAIFIEVTNNNGAGPYTTGSYFNNVGNHPSTSTVASGSSRLTSIVFNGTTASQYQNGTLDPAAYSAASNFAIRVLSIGSDPSNAANSTFQGDVAEVLVYNSALNTTNRQAVESYLKTRWGTP